MASLAHLEQQINNINTLNKTSSRALENFADTSNSISTRARQITKDVRPWEVAQENIALTIEEMAKAARCYHPPPSLSAVLNKKDLSPQAVARCVDYLVYTQDYLASHPPNVYGESIEDKTMTYIQKIVEISEEIVRTSFLKSFQKGKTPVPSAILIKNPEALDNVALVIQRLGENFNQTDVVKVEVFNIISEKVKQFAESHFDASYREEEIGKGSLSTHASMSPVLKHYQKGENKLLGISASVRACVEEIATCLNTNILVPLDDDYAVAEMPSEIAIMAFDIIMSRADTLIKFDLSNFNDPTKMFVLSRGQGFGLCPGIRYFRDIIFIGLDVLEELWNWKKLSSNLPGENDLCVDYVDRELERFIYQLRDLLEGYANCKGMIQKDLLIEYTRSMRRLEWIPALDCTAHESSTNVLYFHKLLLCQYFGSLKLVLYGSPVDSSGDMEATREVEDYLLRCIIGSLADLVTMAEATVELQDEAEEKGRRRMGKASVNQLLNGESSKSRLSLEVFLINNIIFLYENYKKEPCFTQRLFPVEEEGPKKANGNTKSKKKNEPPQQKERSLISSTLSLLNDEKERYIDEYGLSWEKCFPDIFGNETFNGIPRDASVPLRKSQRAAVKSYYKELATNLGAKVNDCRTQAVMDSNVRGRLIDASVLVVKEGFRIMDDILMNRKWSDRPKKYLVFEESEWLDQIRGAF